MRVSFNINDRVRVRLTADGARVYSRSSFAYAEVQAGHVLEAQLWVLFSIFGPKSQLGRGFFMDGNLEFARS